MLYTLDTISKPRVVFFGMTGRFSLIPLLALLEAGVDVRAVAVPAGHGPPVAPLHPPRVAPIPLHVADEARTIIGLAWERGIPVFAVRQLASPDLQAWLTQFEPDVACVSCFSRRIPASLLAIPRHGFWNVHPSLLPLYRGPSPLFWVLRDGGQAAGVTVHMMDEGFDTGPIIVQQTLDLPIGISGPDADALCAKVGGRLLLQALDALGRDELHLQPQLVEGCHAPTPVPADFQIDATWSAERVFVFMRGTAEWNRSYPLVIGDTTLLLTYALRYDSAARLAAPFREEKESIAIQCNPGVVWAHGRVRRVAG